MKSFTFHGRLSTMLISFVVLTFTAFNTAQSQPYKAYSIIETYAGKGRNTVNPDLKLPSAVVMDKDGNYYFSDVNAGRVYKVDHITHTATVYAGSTQGYSGDGDSATKAKLLAPISLAFDSKDNLYISDQSSWRIRKVDKLSGKITTVAGNGNNTGLGDGGLAINASFANWGIALDANDNLYIADISKGAIRKVDALNNTISTVIGAGTFGYSGDGGPARNAQFSLLTNFCIDANGNFFIVDNLCIRKVTAGNQVISTIAGSNTPGAVSPYTNGILATNADIAGVNYITADAAGNLYLGNTQKNVILQYSAATQRLTTFAGSFESGFFGNNVAASQARIERPRGLVISNAAELVFIQERFQALRKVTIATGIISDVYVAEGNIAGDIGDGKDADSAQFNTPRDVAVDPDGNVYIADGLNQRIRKVDKTTNIITSIAGTGETGFGGEGGKATEARFSDPAGMAFDNQGNLLIADRNNNRIRKVDKLTGIITTVAGNGDGLEANIGGPAINASFAGPTDMVVDSAGNMYFSVSASGSLKYGNIIYKVSTNGIISRFAGLPVDTAQGNAGYSGDSGFATAARLNLPHGLVIDKNGNLIFCDKGNHVIRKINLKSNIITTIAGTGTPGRAGDGGLAINAQLSSPDDLAFNPDGNLVIADLGNNQMRLLDMSNDTLYTVAGTGTGGYSGDGGQAILAELNGVDGMAIDANGLTYIADQFNNRIRTFPKPTIILPVSLINFRATATGQDALLQWSTASEQNAASFNIQRSANGQGNWQTIGTVAAVGNSSTLLNYAFTDNNTLRGSNYYRLRQVDIDNTTTYSPVIVVNFRSGVQQEFGVYPSPVRDYVTVTLNSRSNSAGIVTIIDASGAVQLQRSVQLKAGNNAFTISNLGSLSAGMYFLRVTFEGSNTPMVKKLLKM